MLPGTAESKLPWVANMWLSKDLNLIPREQKGIKLLKFLASVTAWEHWRLTEPAQDSCAPAELEPGTQHCP